MITYGNLGGNLGSPFYQNLGDSAGAREYYGKAVAIARELAKADTSDQLAQYDLANSLLFYATLEIPKEEWPGSLILLREADGILQKLIAADPQSVSKLRALAMVEEYEGRRLESLGNRDEAIIQYRRSIAAVEKALGRNPSDLSSISQILASQEALAEALARQGDHSGALRMARTAVTLAEQVSSPESERDRVARYIATAYLSVATVQSTFGNWSEARAASERAVAGYRRLIASGSRRVFRAEVTHAEALLQECITHLQ
jgi:tetratricopeptide (TPR) repeat protein